MHWVTWKAKMQYAEIANRQTWNLKKTSGVLRDFEGQNARLSRKLEGHNP